MEGEPRELASQIHSDVTLRTAHKVLAPAPIQKVLVVGGGVGGVYAALDIAEQGYPVYLLESNPSIGGIMAALDKTCLLYTSDAADDLLCVDLGGRRIIKKKTNTILT